MATITSVGIGSGVDINGLVTQLVDAEKELPELRMNTREAELQAQLTSMGTLKGALSGFQTKINALRTPSGASGLQSSVSDRDVLTTSVSPAAEEGKHSVEVKSLAQSHTLASAAFESETTEIGTGVLTFSFGTTAYDTEGDYTSFTGNKDKTEKTVTISDGSLQGIRDAVNEADIGVTASIVNTGPEGYKLLFKSDDLGENNSLRVAVTDGDDDHLNGAGLSQLAYSVDAQNMTETTQAKHAELEYNGLTIKRSSNTVDDLIKGVTLNLKSQSEEGKTVNIDVSKNTDSLIAKAKDFVSGFNEMMGTINSMTSYNAETEQGGVLLGDAVTRSMTIQFRRIVGDSIRIGDNNNLTLASVGIKTQEDGSLSLDEEVFEAAAEKDPNIVANLFSITGNTQGNDLRYVGVSSKTETGTYRVSISQPATQGKYTGGGVINDATYTVDASNDTLQIKVDGVESETIKITQGSYASAESLASKIQASINNDSKLQEAGISVNVAVESDKLVITSAAYGSDSKVELLSANGLGLSDGAGVDGVDVAGSFGVGTASGDGQMLLGTSGDARDLLVEYKGTSSGSVGGVTTSRGFADQLYNVIEGFLADDGGIEGKTKSIQDSIVDINEQRVALDKRLLTLETRWRRQFGAMDALVAQLQATGNFLTQQLEALPKVEVRK